MAIILWAMIWAGIYSDPSYIFNKKFFYTFFDIFQGLRALLPILAGFYALMVIVRSRNKKASADMGPNYYFVLYGLVGATFFLASPNPVVSLYWAFLYLSVLIVIWLLHIHQDSLENLRKCLNLNMWVCIIMTLFFFLGPIRPMLSGAPRYRLFDLPFGLGSQTANGVARFVAIAALIAVSRLRLKPIRLKILWAIIFGFAFIVLLYSQSRSALLGFGLAALVLILISRKYLWLLFGTPVLFYYLYMSWFVWRARGNLVTALFLSGREGLWDLALKTSLKSPLFGFGFHADRFMLEGEHVHMAYLHSLIQSGLLGAIFFLVGIFGICSLIIRSKIWRRISKVEVRDSSFLLECIAIIVFLLARSFFESTAAFYGVDLLVFIPAVGFLYQWLKIHPESSP